MEVEATYSFWAPSEIQRLSDSLDNIQMMQVRVWRILKH